MILFLFCLFVTSGVPNLHAEDWHRSVAWCQVCGLLGTGCRAEGEQQASEWSFPRITAWAPSPASSPTPPICGKNVYHETCLWCQKEWELLFYIQLLIRVYCNFVVHIFDLFLKEDPAFYIILSWWWWTPLAFSCLGRSSYVLWLLMISLLGRVFFVVGSCFSWLSIFLPIPFSLQSFFWEISWQSYGSTLVGNCFSLAFKILSLSFTFSILIMMCLGVGLYGLILFETLCFLDFYV